mmetsp:Transcript_18145/g.31010  ORF Transcript_18145/g.31010 Transcript_18145/m.31010 type:complete len:157 (+) Transcript_18145:710-1180(+)
MGYSLELVLNLLMMFCQFTNNVSTPSGSLTIMQSVAMLIKILTLLLMVAELVMLIWEIRIMQVFAKEIGDANFKPLNEKARRREYSSQVYKVGLVSVFLFVVFVIGTIVGERRECLEGQALENAVCVDCSQEVCNMCSENSQVCEECSEGYHLKEG